MARGGADIAGVYLEDLCFNAQQAAEKAIKALLLSLAVDFPFSHDLAELLSEVERAGVSVPDAVKRARTLSDYAVETRYPGAWEPVTREDYAEAVSIAQDVLRWAEERVWREPLT